MNSASYECTNQPSLSSSKIHIHTSPYAGHVDFFALDTRDSDGGTSIDATRQGAG